jgi:hypothetical protein
MPVGLMKLRTGTPPELEGFRDDPEALYNHVKGVIERAGAALEALYFDIGKERAFALVTGLDDYIAVKAVARVLGAEGFIKLITVDQAVEAVERDRQIREGSGSSS